VRSRTYLLIALLVFFVAVTGSDLFARITIGQRSLMGAITEHIEWAGMTLVGLLLLLAPFPVVGLICAIANKRARTRSAVAIFAAAMIALLCFYFGAFQMAERALLDAHWTAAALSIGLLPFFIGIPAVLLTAIAAALAASFDQHLPQTRIEEEDPHPTLSRESGRGL
jgi:hypothetical protein